MNKGVAREGGGRAPPPEFGRAVNSIQTKGGRLCPSQYCQPPGFKMLSTPMMNAFKCQKSVLLYSGVRETFAGSSKLKAKV